MALTESENKIETTMSNLPGAGFPIGYANIMRVMIDAQGNFTAEVRRYYSEVERQENPQQTPGLIGVGGPLSQGVKDKVFTLIYPEVEAWVNIQALMSAMQKEHETAADDAEKATITEKYGLLIDDVKTTMGIKE